jgi:peptidoglycan/xylan/chitin deacetylase (PgdA/CDA1 family)
MKEETRGVTQIPWPKGNRCAAVLSFDEDGECVPLIFDSANGGRRLTLQSDASYGPDVGTPRILDLLDRHGIQASFFVPGFTAERHPDLLREMVVRGHEVGHHGYLHERLDSVGPDEEERILIHGMRILESITGKTPRGYRSPAWELNPTTPALLKRHGFVYDSSLMGDDQPYLIPAGEGEPLIEIPVQWINDDWPHFGFCSNPSRGFGISSQEKVFEIWSEEFAGYYDYGGCYVLTMHPFVIGRPSRIRLLSRMIELINGFEGVWWATLEQVADHVNGLYELTLRPYSDLTITHRP